MFDIRFTEGAMQDLKTFSLAKQKWIVTALELKLEWDATQESRDRKRLRPQPIAEWAMRLGEVRVFYDVDIANRVVKVEALGRQKPDEAIKS